MCSSRLVKPARIAAARRLLERLVDKQWLIAGDEINLGQAAVELTLELTERDFQKVFGLRPFELLERHGLILEQHGNAVANGIDELAAARDERFGRAARRRRRPRGS